MSRCWVIKKPQFCQAYIISNNMQCSIINHQEVAGMTAIQCNKPAKYIYFKGSNDTGTTLCCNHARRFSKSPNLIALTKKEASDHGQKRVNRVVGCEQGQKYMPP